jgi:hypothetical protein
MYHFFAKYGVEENLIMNCHVEYALHQINQAEYDFQQMQLIASQESIEVLSAYRYTQKLIVVIEHQIKWIGILLHPVNKII